MTKAELVAKIAEEAQISQAQANKALGSFISAVCHEVKDSGSISIAGLGSFSISKRAARTGINPRTREPIKIPASNSVKFKCAKALKEAINPPHGHGGSGHGHKK
ncbi:MAG: HU family DNA-binding protein [Deltaproteobacteria bacterium]|jgi:DNA-binding protein HU-beta|nr:HU family DNA-binding protein [Deltaproteobacteria bacterium]